jgi:hypothetical protein
MTRNPAPLWPWGGPIPRVGGDLSLRFFLSTEPVWNPTREGDYRIWWLHGLLHPEQTAQTRGQ